MIMVDMIMVENTAIICINYDDIIRQDARSNLHDGFMKMI
jgi:hypothetical protein